MPRYTQLITCMVMKVIESNDVTIIALPLHTGQLGMISDLKINSTSSMIHLNWEAPFSLNLSAVYPDIVYCLDIFKVNDVELSRDHLVSDYSVLETRYNFTMTSQDPRDLLQFSVTPRSNVEGARNGMPTIVAGSSD